MLAVSMASADLESGKSRVNMLEFQPKIIPDGSNIHDVHKVILSLSSKNEHAKMLAFTREALGRFPKDEFIFVQFCMALEGVGNDVAALSALKQGLRQSPRSAVIHGSLVALLFRRGDLAEMSSELRKLIEKFNRNEIPKGHRASSEIVLSKLSTLCLYRDDLSDQEKWRIHKETSDLILRQSKNAMPALKQTNAKPRIGFLSTQINNHAVGRFIVPFLQNANFKKCDFYIYFDELAGSDAAYSQTVNILSGRPFNFRKINSGKNAEAANIIRKDQIDILIDLSGRFSGGPYTLLALRPAPIQASWIGYPMHPGLKTIDFMLSDQYCEPRADLSGGEGEGSIYHFNRFFSCYAGPSEKDLSSKEPPVVESDVITFGSFNNIDKVSEKTVDLWAAVLRSVPTSEMLLKFYDATPVQKNRIFDNFMKLGVNPSRIRIAGKVEGVKNHLRMYNHVDIALDTFPYNGTTTTCEALWMGVPVVTRLGSSHLSRVSAGILRSVGLPELIGKTDFDFVDLAVQLAGDIEQIKVYKRTIRDMMIKSELCDAKSMSDHFDKFVDFAIMRISADV